MVYYAIVTQRQFYPTILFLVTSKLSFIISGNMLLATILMLANLFKALYFGTLRDLEG
jgi:E3 ubiquitin-protein ligase synoviolin